MHVIASDAHDADGRPPGLLCALAAFERRYEAPRELFDWMTTGVPAAILAGGPLPPRPPLPRRARAAAPAAQASLTIAITVLIEHADHDQHLHPDPERGHPQPDG